MQKQPFLYFLLTLLFGHVILAQERQKQYWPKVIPLEQASITIYAPQPESFDGNTIEVRSAFNYYDGTSLPVFGAMWLRARVHIDKPANHVFFDNIEMLEANFPDVSQTKKKNLSNLIAAVAPTWQFNSSYEIFLAGLKRQDLLRSESEALLNDPPNIYYETSNTALVFVDGEPIYENIDNSELYRYIINTPYFIVNSQSDGYHYLAAGAFWFRAKNFYDEWQLIEQPAQTIIRLKERFDEYNSLNDRNIDKVNSSKPKLIMTIFPAQLIQTYGDPERALIPGTELFEIKNSPNNLLYDRRADYYYVLFSGRWYRSTTLRRGKWQFVEPKNIPIYFRKLPINSVWSKYRISLPGTPEALSAALDNGLPQTAIIDRKLAKINVEYDGEPEFQPISGTTMSYAVNTNVSVIKHGEVYHAVDAGVWFRSDSPLEGWRVATSVPEEVDDIPPSSPVYNMKYVYIYEISDKYVYTGYTGGYTGNFLFQGCVFYGTGYQYKPWYKSKYYARPMTFAFGVNRNYNKSNISVSVGYGYPGFYSPYGYGFGSYGYAHLNGNFEYEKGYTKKALDPNNVYNNRAQGVVATETVRRNNPYQVLAPEQQDLRGNRLPPTNLYSTANGDVYKQDGDGQWFRRSDGIWVQTSSSPFDNH